MKLARSFVGTGRKGPEEKPPPPGTATGTASPALTCGAYEFGPKRREPAPQLPAWEEVTMRCNRPVTAERRALLCPAIGHPCIGRAMLCVGVWTFLSGQPKGLPDGSRKSPGGVLGTATSGYRRRRCPAPWQGCQSGITSGFDLALLRGARTQYTLSGGRSPLPRTTTGYHLPTLRVGFCLSRQNVQTPGQSNALCSAPPSLTHYKKAFLSVDKVQAVGYANNCCAQRDADINQPTPRPQWRLLSERTCAWFSSLGRESRGEVLSGSLKARTQRGKAATEGRRH
jgi:hypothetical protein